MNIKRSLETIEIVESILQLRAFFLDRENSNKSRGVIYFDLIFLEVVNGNYWIYKENGKGNKFCFETCIDMFGYAKYPVTFNRVITGMHMASYKQCKEGLCSLDLDTPLWSYAPINYIDNNENFVSCKSWNAFIKDDYDVPLYQLKIYENPDTHKFNASLIDIESSQILIKKEYLDSALDGANLLIRCCCCENYKQ